MLKLGLAPTRRDVFSREDAAEHKHLIEDTLREWQIDFVNLDWLNDEGLLYADEDAGKVAAHFREENVDAIFCPHVNFGTESAVAKLAAEIDKPLLLWGPRDDAPLPDGQRTRDTQCGLFATSKVLRRFGVPFTYVVNSSVDSEEFEAGFDTFIRAAAVVKAFRGMRIGQISTRPEPFWTVMCNESELLEKFGIEVVPLSMQEFTDMAGRIRQEEPEIVKEEAEELTARMDEVEMNDEKLKILVSLKLAMKDWANERDLSGLAIQCWDALQDAVGIMPCVANAEVTDLGIPVACETDIHGAVTAVMLQAAALDEHPIFFADLTVRHPENDNAELLWHCGPFPHSLKAEGSEARIGRHFIKEHHAPGVAEWEIRGGEVTIARFDGDRGDYRLFIGEGRGTTGPSTRGTYLWVEVEDWPRWEKKLIYGPYIHHVVGIHGRLLPALNEATRYIPGLVSELADEN